MPHVYVAGGSNIAAEENILRAAAELRTAFPGARFSACYANAAVGFSGDEFINFVVELPTPRSLADVIHELRRIETLCGRPRNAPRWAPRSMDLDVLLYDDLVLTNADVKLPRPDLLTRPYMLGPMAQIAPQVLHPTVKRSIGELWEDFDRASHPMRRLALNLGA
ncbi:MAG: 2-amino-4-hydroxy-6-hydroxymethyldihydropteridine diphosphokinase [Steroidobacteraceae bacterium]